jgi:hypothetical protein
VGFEYDVIEAARQDATRLVVGTPQHWLTTRGHLEPVVQREAPAETLALLDVIHRALGGNARALARTTSRPLATDLMGPNGELIELDEVQHFTAERRKTLGWYPNLATFGFSLDAYRNLIDAWKARANAVFTRQWSADFDFQGGRRAHRAYFDAVCDLLAPTFTGMQLVRVPVVDHNARAAARAIAAAHR